MSGEKSEDGAVAETKVNRKFDITYMRHKGILICECEIDEIKKLEIRDNDIWVCTFPRSGKTTNFKYFHQFLGGKENTDFKH